MNNSHVDVLVPYFDCWLQNYEKHGMLLQWYAASCRAVCSICASP